MEMAFSKKRGEKMGYLIHVFWDKQLATLQEL